jgi:hypothetical protein
MFLPWYNELDAVVQIITTFKRAGAAAHPGARYYTDQAPVGNQHELDPFMPDLAFYVHARMKSSTLTESPHLSLDVASRANERWRSFVAQITKEGITAVTPEQWTRISRILGIGAVTVDVEDDNSIAAAALRQKELARSLREV